MKPVDFDLHRPESLEQAIGLLVEHGEESKVLAGGQSLVPLLNFRLARPEHLIDLSRIASLTSIRRSVTGLTIGAMVTHAQAERSSAVASGAPLMACAFPHIAHRAIRARGTIGGSIAHGDPAAELPAVVTALDATIVARGPRGEREIKARDFFLANLVTVLNFDEVLTEIRLEPPVGPTGAAFEEVARRQGDFALVGAGAQISLADNGSIRDIRICLTGVSPTPHRAVEAESILAGNELSASRLDEATEAVRGALTPSGDLHATADYRRNVAGTLVSRVVQKAARRATAQETWLEREGTS